MIYSDTREYAQKYRDAHKKQIRANQKRYLENNKEHIKELRLKSNERRKSKRKMDNSKERAYSKQYYQEHKEKCKEYSRLYAKINKDYVNAQNRKYIQQKRMIVLEAYGGQPPKCACCGERHIEFLSIDHINGGGRKHRISLGTGGGVVYSYLIKNNFPSGYRILCMNCNTSLGRYGYCPHGNIEGVKTNGIA